MLGTDTMQPVMARTPATPEFPSVVAERVQQRLTDLGLSARDASLKAGGSEFLVSNILQGKSRNPRSDTLDALAAVLRTTPEWLRGKEGASETEIRLADITPPNRDLVLDVPVRGTALGALLDGQFEGFDFFGSDPVDYVRRPPGLANVRDAYAFFVNGDSMDPAHPHGALRFANPHRPVSINDTVVVQTKKWESDPGQGYIKKLKRRTGAALILEQYNPPATIEIPVRYVVSVHKVPELAELYGV